MILFIRFVLVCTIIYLIIRSFARYFEEQQKTPPGNHEQDNKNVRKTRGVSKEIGEYVDYEDVDK